jgi:radical SAM protein with 4Fe4S-binding SPASM domain
MAINWNGTVSACNEDWAHVTLVGDARTQSVKEIWNGDKFNAFRMMHLELKRKENPACAHCDYIQVFPDNIDEYRKDIIRRLK